MEVVARTIEYPANENSGKIALLNKIQIILDVRGIWVIGPRRFLNVRHGLDAPEGGSDSVGRVSRRRRIWGSMGEGMLSV